MFLAFLVFFLGFKDYNNGQKLGAMSFVPRLDKKFFFEKQIRKYYLSKFSESIFMWLSISGYNIISIVYLDILISTQIWFSKLKYKKIII